MIRLIFQCNTQAYDKTNNYFNVIPFLSLPPLSPRARVCVRACVLNYLLSVLFYVTVSSYYSLLRLFNCCIVLYVHFHVLQFGLYTCICISVYYCRLSIYFHSFLSLEERGEHRNNTFE